MIMPLEKPYKNSCFAFQNSLNEEMYSASDFVLLSVPVLMELMLEHALSFSKIFLEN